MSGCGFSTTLHCTGGFLPTRPAENKSLEETVVQGLHLPDIGLSENPEALEMKAN